MNDSNPFTTLIDIELTLAKIYTYSEQPEEKALEALLKEIGIASASYTHTCIAAFQKKDSLYLVWVQAREIAW